MTNERAIEILNPTHREHYESIGPVNEACRMGMDALDRRVPKSPYPGGDTGVLAKKLEFAVEPDPKKPGKFKITDQEHMADLWDMAGEILGKK